MRTSIFRSPEVIDSMVLPPVDQNVESAVDSVAHGGAGPLHDWGTAPTSKPSSQVAAQTCASSSWAKAMRDVKRPGRGEVTAAFAAAPRRLSASPTAALRTASIGWVFGGAPFD